MSRTEDRRLQLMHRARAKEVEIAFAHAPKSAFATGLELGAGDCYQSQFLKRHVVGLVCTDFDETLLTKSDPEISYGRCDAEEVDRVFAEGRFELVFSSNMLSHTPHPQRVLIGARKVTTDDAILVIVVPSPLWKIAKLALFYPLLLIGLPRRLWGYLSRMKVSGDVSSASSASHKSTNNPKVSREASRWRERLCPVPIGVYEGNIAEVLGSRRARWVSELELAGWEVLRVFRGPFIVGDMNLWWNDVFAHLGFSTEQIFVARKWGCRSKYESLFV